MILLPAMLLAAALPAKVERINLVDSARVVRFEGDSPDSLEVRGLERGTDGWEAWAGPDGQYMIGVEWDEPRDLAEVNIEFRHAIANRDQIRVQYWKRHWPSDEAGGWARLDDPFHGEWVDAKADWWAGDRDVTFAFLPYNQEHPDESNQTMAFRRTYRLRFVLGQDQLPPVRYLRAYGPQKPVEGSFELTFDPDASLRPPLSASVVNGGIVADEEGRRTTTQATELPDPAVLRVVYASGDDQTSTRTIVTLRGEKQEHAGFSFLPVDVAREGRIHIAPLGVSVRLAGASTAAPPASQPTYYDRIAREPEQTWERARREIPVLIKSEQVGEPLYLPLAPPHTRQEIGVSYDGSILLDLSALKVGGPDNELADWPGRKWYLKLATGENFDQSAEGAVKQRLLEGCLPIVINTWETGGVRYEQTCVATYLHGEPAALKGDEPVVLLSRLLMSNPGSQEAVAQVKLQVRAETAATESLQLEGAHVLATGFVSPARGEQRAYEAPLYRLHLDDGADGVQLVESAQDAGVKACVLAYRAAIPAGGQKTFEYRVPFITLRSPADRQAISKLDFEQVLQSESRRWRTIIEAAAQIEVPEPLLNDFYKASLSHILITSDRDPYNGTDVLPAATYGYKVCLNESCHQIRSLDMRGLHEDARRYLDAIVAGQSSRELHGRFTDKKGVLHGLPSKKGNYQSFRYNLDHGFALWTLAEHYRFTRDDQWAGSVAGAMIQACDFITRQRNPPGPEGNTLAKSDTFWGQGLLPPGHLEDPPEWLWWLSVNAYACRGMQSAAQVLREIRHPEAGRIAGDADDYSERLRLSCAEAMLRAPVMRHSDGAYWPFQPTRTRLRGRDLGWIRDVLYGPIHLIDCGIYPYDSAQAEWILRDAENNVFLSAERGRELPDPDLWFSWGGITIQSNLLPNPLAYLHRGQPKYAIRAFWNSLAANVYEDVRTFTEHPVAAYGLGRGPFFKSPDEAAFIVWLRHLLFMESGSDLDLLAGVPAAWLEPGKKIRVRQAATWFGPLDLEVKSTPGELVVQLAPPKRNPPGQLRLHNRRPGRPSAITIKNAPAPTDAYNAESGILTLPGRSEALTIRFAY